MLGECLFDEWAWSIIVLFLSPSDVVRFGRTCNCARAYTADDWATWWFVQSGLPKTQLVAALNALGVTPNDLIDILQALRQAGALNAEIEVQ